MPRTDPRTGRTPPDAVRPRRGRAKSSDPAPAGLPTLAVVLCTRDREPALHRTLDALWRQTRPPDELIVIDDGRLSDAARAEFAAHASRRKIRWIYHRKSPPGLTASRNTAARLARSDVLLYLDDDVSCDAAVVAETVAAFRDPDIAGLAPAVLEPTWSQPAARIVLAGYRLAGWWSIRPRPGRPPRTVPRRSGRLGQGWDDRPPLRPARWLSGAAMALRRDVVLSNPFDERLAEYALGEDREISYRLAPRRLLVAAPHIHVVHRRDAPGRPDERRFGFMTSFNYLYILRKTCRLGPGDALVLLWTFLCLTGFFFGAAVAFRSRRHLDSLLGLLDGLCTVWLARGMMPRFAETERRREPGGALRPAVAPPNSVRVLFVTNRLEHGGAEWVLLSLVRQLPRFGVRPAVLCLKDAGPLSGECRARGAPVFEGLLRYKTDAAAIPRIAELLRRESIDVVVPVGSGGDRMFWSTLAARWTGRRVIVWSHWFPTPAQPRFERPNRLLYRWVDRFVALGRAHRDALARVEFVPAGRIRVVPNGVEPPRFDLQGRRNDARALLGLKPRQVGIALVGNLRAEKRHDVFVAAVARLAPDFPQARFFIIGDGPHRAAVESVLRRVALPETVLRFLGARDDVPLLLAGLDVVCLCSEVECLSITMLEAAAAGCAFAGPLVGSMNEFLEDGVTGLATRPADVDSLAAALGRLIADAPLRRRLAAEARDRVLASFTVDRAAREFSAVLHAAAARRRPARVNAPSS